MIHINDDYAIQADAHCYSIVKRSIAGEGAKEPGKEYWTPIESYHATVSGALRALCRRLHRQAVQSTDMYVDEAYGAYRQLQEQLARFEEAGA